jgi:RNA polymerase sigma factor (TIGR02999 family)
MNDVTLLLQAMERGDEKASEELLPLVYNDLRQLASFRMSQEAAGHTLQPTALVHEAWLRIIGSNQPSWQSRVHFFSAAAEAMRRILIESARRKARLKHGGGKERVDIDSIELAETTPDEKLLLVDEALYELEQDNPERARVVVLKYFGGLTNEEVSETLGISVRTVNRHWLCAKTWLFRKLQADFEFFH